ncbi:MAG: hypothetical protein ACKOXL_07570 [Limnohabitans sp.]
MQNLSADDLAAWIAAHPAEACTELGHTEPPRKAPGEWLLLVIVGTPIALVLGGLLAVAMTTAH